MSTDYIIKNVLNGLPLLDWKNKTFGVKLSTTFPVRTKCKYCLGSPTEYYYIRTPIKWLNPNRIRDQFDAMKKWLKRLTSDHYLDDHPREFVGISSFNFYLPYSKFNPALHHKRGVKPVEDIIEILSCDCRRSNWAFVQKAHQNRPDILCREARSTYPHKYEDWY